ncbi:MAG: N-acetylmuramoyl-L-alanine amidase [Microthrixaceae bacterium]|nr:N-acetylmuramoyl-L-alanine amidase [Microthrixaceae bacterium]
MLHTGNGFSGFRDGASVGGDPLKRTVLVLAAVAVLSACGSNASTEAETATTTSSPTTTTTVATSTTTTVATSTTTTTTVLATSTTAAATTAVPATSTSSAAGSLAGRVIVVDPGHNGANGSHSSEINRQVDAGGFKKACNTTGTSAAGYAEHQFNWEVATRVAALLRSRGATVILTRPDNNGWGPCVDERGRTASTNGADAMVSIHADGSSASNHGFHIIHPAVVANHTEAIVEPSQRLAGLLRDELVASGLSPSNYIGRQGLNQRGDLGTLNLAGVPVVMLESGNMHNSGDLAMLRSAEGQDRIAESIVRAFEGYFA